MLIYEKETVAKPFLKWAGGKGQLIEQIENHLPRSVTLTGKIKKYFEPFVGGGAIFFWLSQEYRIEEAFLYDVNPEIIIAYQTIQSKTKALISGLRDIEREYFHTKKEKGEKYFYDRRIEYNGFISSKVDNHKVRRTALIIFLNKTCFNGLFRVNTKGLFNVPFGRYENPNICDEENLLATSSALQNAEIACCDFSECLKHAVKESFIYFDPPYRPISKTASFTGYIKNGFDDNEQRRLKLVFDKLDAIGADVMLSNSDPKNIDPKDNFFDDLYDKYEIHRLDATRMINCNSSKRGLIKEILITNY